MATSDELDNASKAAKELNAEFNAINNALTDLTSKLIQVVETTEGFDAATKRTANTFQKDLSKALDNVKKNNTEIAALQTKQLNGAKLNASEQKKLDVLLKRQAADREKAESALNNLRGEGVNISAELELQIQEQLDTSEALGASAQQLNTNLIAQRGILGAVADNAKEYLISLDKSGLAVVLLNGDLDNTQKLMLAGEAGLMAIAKGALVASANIANIAKETGISYESSLKLQREFAIVALNTDKAFVSSIALNKSFRDLVQSTGIVSDFGGDTLITMTALTKQLGLGVTEASQLALLARTQGTDTEGVLENTVATVNAVNRQNGAAISAKAVLNDVATASKSIVVSLGMSPEILAEAATKARALGLSLAQVDAIAGSLLDFESSIENELAFQMLTGKEINLDKARQLALDNDLVGLTEEIKNNAALTEAYSTGNRIQQEAAAKALGMSREDLGDMVYKQELIRLGAEGFKDAYGEQTYSQMQSQSAAEKFEDSMVKIQSVIGDVALALAPVIDAVAAIAESSFATYTVLGLIAGVSLAKTIGSLVTMGIQMGIISLESITTASALSFGLGALAIAAGIGIIAAASKSAKSQTVADGIAPSSKGPFTITDSYGAMATTTAGDSLMASPNVGKGGGDSKMVALLEKIANKDSNVYMDSSKVGTSMAMATSRI